MFRETPDHVLELSDRLSRLELVQIIDDDDQRSIDPRERADRTVEEGDAMAMQGRHVFPLPRGSRDQRHPAVRRAIQDLSERLARN